MEQKLVDVILRGEKDVEVEATQGAVNVPRPWPTPSSTGSYYLDDNGTPHIEIPIEWEQEMCECEECLGFDINDDEACRAFLDANLPGGAAGWEETIKKRFGYKC